MPRQQILSRDGLNCQIESVIIYHMFVHFLSTLVPPLPLLLTSSYRPMLLSVNPYRSAFAIQDVRTALVERAQTTLRDVCGNRNLQSLLTEREAVATEIEQIVEQSAEKWGVAVESILIKDIVVPQEVQNALSAGAQARRNGEAKVITARAEVDSKFSDARS